MKPKICLSVSGKSFNEDVELIIKNYDKLDMAEVRLDGIYGIEYIPEEDLKFGLAKIKKALGDKLLLACYHGNRETQIKLIYRSLGAVDLIDIPYMYGANEYIDLCHDYGEAVILSYHDYSGTPEADEIAKLYFDMSVKNADVIKIAVMAKNEEDLPKLLTGASVYTDQENAKPIIAISMGEYGKESRVCAGEFGSVITYTFCGKESAPGQIEINELRELIDKYYK